ncbi:MAG: serine/threonine-protein kinase, partial [Acidobacteriota bacterium]
MKKMDAERWRKIERIYNIALELEPIERETFLHKACEEDASIREDVLRLLENQKEAGSFMESPAVNLLAGIKTNKESFLPGKQVNSYKIISKIGRGGMGEVYQARDLKLGREVAVKILPEEFAGDMERVARFQREAKLLASLNHTNVAAIYGLEEAAGMQFLVLELVEGEMLSDKIARCPIPVEEALKFSIQMAEGLEAAHEKGIIHRDLKPANVMITSEENVKLLDFGLAKALAEETRSIDSSKSPTLTEEMTRPDVILGTAAYMSPEQAKGKTVDKRTDIWAFGCVLYEMLTGQAVFQGESVTEILASVLRADINLELLPENVNPKVKEILVRCLQKNPRERYRDIGDVLYDMKQLQSDPTGFWMHSRIGAEHRNKITTLLPWFIAFSGMLIIGIGVWLLKPTPPGASSKVVFQHELLPGQEFSNLEYPALAVSPDGKQIVYGTSTGLYLRSIDRMDPRLLSRGEENPQQPFFSPDGEWVGYFSEKEKLLKKVRIHGGTPVELCPVILLLGASWNDDDTILFGQLPYGIMRVPASGGDPELIFKKEDIPLAQPQLLPDKKSLLLTIEVDG